MAQCRRCGGELDPDGTCATCLLAGGLDTGEDTVLDTGVAQFEAAEALEYDSFGPYRIVRLLGEGGMGAVYLAEQTRPIHRRVALKVVKLGLTTSQVLSRFNYERQAVALMDHPNIACVFDAGASGKGRPYFVMEYVKGLPITRYCDQRLLNIRERLALFVSVCQALQHAHQKGVIHRDIKPSNVMVTEIDGRPVPKVIDFGIARATEGLGAGNTSFTQLGQFLGTPEYMSPEQADLVTGDVDTSSDVYSLGVLLYELLAGAPPFDPQVLRQASLTELLRILREEEALPMPAKLAGMGETATAIAANRRTDPATLLCLVRGDLNWIVAKAIEKDRARRYPAASELAADIHRHLTDQPVLASPPSARYRARKFVRRHKFAAAASAAVLAALIAGIFTTTWEASIARRERSQALAARALAEQQRNRAEEQTARARSQQELAERERSLAEERLNDVHALADSMLFEINEDIKDLPGGTRAREALIRLGQQYLNKEAAAEQDARRRDAIAEAFLSLADLQGGPGESNLRDLTGARQSYARSAALLEAEIASRPHDPYPRHLLTLSYVRQAELDESPASARALLDRAAKSAAIYLAQWPGALQGMRDRAEVLETNDDFAAAIELRKRILAAKPENPVLRWELAHAQLLFGSWLAPKNRKQSLIPFQSAVDACQALIKEDPANIRYQRDLAVALSRMAQVLVNVSQTEAAMNGSRLAVKILEQLTASDPLNASFRLDLSAALAALSAAYYDNGKVAEALQTMARATSIQEQQAERFPDNPDFRRQAAANYRMAARFNVNWMNLEGALRQYRKAEAIDRALAARYPGRFELADALRTDLDLIGATLLALGDAPSALRRWRGALEIAKGAAAARPTGEFFGSLASAHESIAEGLSGMRCWDEAAAEQRLAIALYERAGAAKPRDRAAGRLVAHSYAGLSKILEGRGDYRDALAASEKARTFLEADYASHPQDETARNEVRDLLNLIQFQYVLVADYDRAIAAGARRVEILAGTGPAARSRANKDLAATLRLSGRRQGALDALRSAAGILDREFPLNAYGGSPYYRNMLATCFLEIAEGYADARREEDSAAILQRFLPVVEILARDDPDNRLYRATLLRLYGAAAATFLSSGDVAGALDFERKALQLEPERGSAGDLSVRALRMSRTGALELRLGHVEIAHGIWREALAMFQRTTRQSQEMWSTDRQNRKALDTLRLAELRTAVTLENLNELPQALTLLQAASSHGNSPVDLLNAFRADAVRALWLIEGGRGEYRPFFEGRPPAQEQMQAALADGWRRRADFMADFASPIPARLEAAGKAVEISRQLLAAHPSTANRIRLAHGLLSEGDAWHTAARCSHGAESVSAHQSSRDRYFASLEILNSVRKSGELPAAENAVLAILATNLADADDRLQAARDSRTNSGQ